MTDISESPASAAPQAPQAVDIVKDGSDHAFMTDVIEPSNDVPVIVDFWAPWCGPCKQLMPKLERMVKAEKGKVRLVKINTQEHPGVAGQLGVKSIPAVFGFKDGKPVDFFGGNIPESEITKFIGRLTGASDPAEEAAALVARARDSLALGDPGGAAQDFAQALQLHPENPEALAGLARVYLDSGNMEEAAALITSAPEEVQNHPEVAAVRASITLTEEPPEPDVSLELAAKVEAHPGDLDARLELAKALAASGRNAEAVDHLLFSIDKNRAHDEEAARHFLLTIFEAEGNESEISKDGRRRLSSILFA